MRLQKYLTALQDWARKIRRDIHAVYIAARDPRTPWLVRALALAIAAYALSPIDLIPDFIPVLGYLDDAILLPLGLLLVIRLIPTEVMVQARDTALAAESRPVSRMAAVAIVCLWIAAAALLLWLFRGYLAE